MSSKGSINEIAGLRLIFNLPFQGYEYSSGSHYGFGYVVSGTVSTLLESSIAHTHSVGRRGARRAGAHRERDEDLSVTLSTCLSIQTQIGGELGYTGSLLLFIRLNQGEDILKRRTVSAMLCIHKQSDTFSLYKVLRRTEERMITPVTLEIMTLLWGEDVGVHAYTQMGMVYLMHRVNSLCGTTKRWTDSEMQHVKARIDTGMSISITGRSYFYSTGFTLRDSVSMTWTDTLGSGYDNMDGRVDKSGYSELLSRGLICKGDLVLCESLHLDKVFMSSDESLGGKQYRVVAWQCKRGRGDGTSVGGYRY
ncbi:hypothetical protein Tco_1274238 [Tanacetum coccineum]